MGPWKAVVRGDVVVGAGIRAVEPTRTSQPSSPRNDLTDSMGWRGSAGGAGCVQRTLFAFVWVK